MLKGRVQVINLWRPILERAAARRAAGGVRLRARSQSDDLVPSDLVYRDRVGETYSVKYNPGHSWYYVPEMRRDEALLLKIADTKTDISARFMPHTSFTDPTTPAGARRAEHRAAHAGVPPGVGARARAPLPHCGRGRGPARQGWEGEGHVFSGQALTRLRASRSGTLSRKRERGLPPLIPPLRRAGRLRRWRAVSP